MAGDLVDDYRAYLGRFDQLAGDVGFGAPAKWKGRLVGKLSYEQFEKRWGEFQKIERVYTETLQRGDTMNDAMIKFLRDRAAELLLERDF